MCEFCHQHGEGKKWYLLMENYSRELLSQDNRKEFMVEFFSRILSKGKRNLVDLEKFDKAPKLLQKLVRSMTVRKYKKNHYGQVLPIEDIEKLISEMKVVVRIPCVCRKITLGKEVRYCFGIGASLHGALSDIPELASNYEILKKDEAIKAFREMDERGLMHSVWTFKTPFIGGICNCDQDCMAYKTRVGHEIPLFFKAEYVAEIDPDKCTGCKSCKTLCQFGAIPYSASEEKCSIDLKKCYGCGVCRTACGHEAITLKDRISVKGLEKEW
jgi:ferredoxin